MLLRNILHEPRDLEVVAINDIVNLDQIAYLLRYDSVHRPPRQEIACGPGWLEVDGRRIEVLQERDPAALPWRRLEIDIAVECTGVFESREGMTKHLIAGARKVLLSAPAGEGGADVTLCFGVNHQTYDPDAHHLISNASCTTNCLAPVLRALDEAFGWQWGLVTTIHAYTGSQSLVDAAQKSMRRGRAANLNIVPTSTGAARAIAEVLPRLDGKIDGMAFRVPVPDGSVIDLVFEVERSITRDAIHDAFRHARANPSYMGVLDITADEVVSSDIIGSELSALVDASSTMVLGERRAKVIAWYDNEWGYAARCRDVAAYVGERLK
jgi:glyceraldehyde 3-phosphate dehydrogenase